MPSKEDLQEDTLIFGDIEKALLSTAIGNNEEEGIDKLSSLFSGDISTEDSELTDNTRGVFRVLKDVTSMMLAPRSTNEPFQALMRMADGRRSALPCDFSQNDLEVLAAVFETVSYAPLLARIGDVLWLCNKPKRPEHAKKAIDCYILAGIDPHTWQLNGKKEFQRAYQLARLLKNSERLSKIECFLSNAFHSEEDRFEDIKLSVAQLIDELSILEESHIDIAEGLERSGEKLLSDGSPESAVQFFELASKKYNQGSEHSKYILMLVKAAECYAQDAETKFSSGIGSKLISSSFFETAIHAYRRVPTKYREEYSVAQKISELRHKLNEAGKHTLDEMGVIHTPFGETDEIIRLSKEHVSGKESEFEAMIFFSGVCQSPDYKEMREREKDSMSKYFLSSLFGSSQYSSDGRVVAKTPAVGLDGDEAAFEAALKDKMIRAFNHEIDMDVRLIIIPALGQVLEEHTIGNQFILEMCHRSPLVPHETVNLVARGIWLGFEYDFSTAIHIVAPQIEKIVRELIKKQGGHTTHLDKEGIEHENGLSTLLDMEEAKTALGEDVLFELKAVFTDSIGSNLRNEVAHGLITDGVAYSTTPVYAWWVLLRMVVHSLTTSIQDNEEPTYQTSTNKSS
ncbi:MAG: DUF4209 domain-containing protein [Methylomarinum sp.]|nr:DUF4209 domain-containing protein [Methylomarinum sp.]